MKRIRRHLYLALLGLACLVGTPFAIVGWCIERAIHVNLRRKRVR